MGGMRQRVVTSEVRCKLEVAILIDGTKLYNKCERSERLLYSDLRELSARNEVSSIA